MDYRNRRTRGLLKRQRAFGFQLNGCGTGENLKYTDAKQQGGGEKNPALRRVQSRCRMEMATREGRSDGQRNRPLEWIRICPRRPDERLPGRAPHKELPEDGFIIGELKQWPHTPGRFHECAIELNPPVVGAETTGTDQRAQRARWAMRALRVGFERETWAGPDNSTREEDECRKQQKPTDCHCARKRPDAHADDGALYRW